MNLTFNFGELPPDAEFVTLGWNACLVKRNDDKEFNAVDLATKNLQTIQPLAICDWILGDGEARECVNWLKHLVSHGYKIQLVSKDGFVTFEGPNTKQTIIYPAATLDQCLQLAILDQKRIRDVLCR